MLLSIVSAFMKRISGLHVFVILILFGSITVLNSCGGGGGGGGLVLPPAASNPAIAIGVSAVAGDSEVTIGWSTVSNATSYHIYRSLASGQTGTQIASVAAPLISYINTGLTNNTTYYYKVDAVNGATDLGMSSQVSATPTSGTPVTITINGTVQYQDKEYGVNGFTGNQPYKAVRYAEVDLVPTAGSIISTVTDSNGIYTISTALSTTISVYVRVKSTATIPGAAPIAVKSLSNALYGVASNNLIPSGNANVNISIPSTSVGGAFNMLDVFTNGFQFVNSLAGSYPPSLSAYWQAGNSNGTYYCPSNGGCSQGEGIYVLNSTGDTDEYDDDVLYHEFGHFTAAHFSQDDSPGGSHMLTDNDLDMRLAWSEGWGDSMPGNIKMWLSSTNPNLLSSSGVLLTEYVDTIPAGVGIAIDMDNPDGTYSPNYYYACGEVAVAKILLDLNKNFSMQDVWTVLTNFQTNHPTPVSLELFWDQWHSLGELTTSPTTSKTIDSFFINRQIFYSSDSFEPDDAMSSASTYTVGVTAPQVHTLYSAGDVDYVLFSATTGSRYTITAGNLKNGADTYITLYNPDLSVNSTNDNYNGITYVSGVNYNYYDLNGNYVYPLNNAVTLSSKIVFTASTSGIYYISVTSSPNRPLSAGRYGSYTLTITSP
jgi:hypothetical protein